MDMMAAGTSAPMATAARQKPANHSGKDLRKSSGTAELVSVGLNARGEREVAEQGNKAKQEAVGRKHRGVATNDVGALRLEHSGRRVRIEHQCQRRTDGERRSNPRYWLGLR